MTILNPTTKKALGIISDLKTPGERSIFTAYGRPSSYKISAFQDIERRALTTPGYNHDLHICGAGSHYFSTVYSYTENGHTTIIKDTKSNIYSVTI